LSTNVNPAGVADTDAESWLSDTNNRSPTAIPAGFGTVTDPTPTPACAFDVPTTVTVPGVGVAVVVCRSDAS